MYVYTYLVHILKYLPCLLFHYKLLEVIEYSIYFITLCLPLLVVGRQY